MQLIHSKRSHLTQGPEGRVILIARCMKGEHWQDNTRKLSGTCACTPPQECNQEDSFKVVCCLFLFCTTLRDDWYKSQLQGEDFLRELEHSSVGGSMYQFYTKI